MKIKSILFIFLLSSMYSEMTENERNKAKEHRKIIKEFTDFDNNQKDKNSKNREEV